MFIKRFNVPLPVLFGAMLHELEIPSMQVQSFEESCAMVLDVTFDTDAVRVVFVLDSHSC